MAAKKKNTFGNARLGSGGRFATCVKEMMSGTGGKKKYSRTAAEKI